LAGGPHGGGAIGHLQDGQFMVRFSDQAEAEAFQRIWLG
jgi:hypothetical protein